MNFTVAKKIIGGFAIISTLLMITSGISISNLRTINKSTLQQSELAIPTLKGSNSLALEISKMSYHITHATEEQSSTTNTIARSLEDISQVANDNNLSMEQVAQVSGKLDELAHQQNELVHRFNV